MVRREPGPSADELASGAARLAVRDADPPIQLGTDEAEPTGELPPHMADLEAIRQMYFAASGPRSSGSMHGLGIGERAVRGPARVLDGDDALDRIEPGDVLIAVTTTCNLNSVFPLLVAVATQEGGLFSHTALLARELGIPAVVGAPGLLGAISDGDVVEIDSSRGRGARHRARRGRYRRRMPVVASKPSSTTASESPLTGALGAEVSGVQLARIDHETKTELHDACLEHKVLSATRSSPVTEHVAYGRRWGSLEQHPFTPNEADHPEIVVLDSTPERSYAAEAWHSDVTWRACPSLGSVLRGVVIPPVGGDTCWANMELAYEQLPDKMKDQIDGKARCTRSSRCSGRSERGRARAEAAEFRPAAPGRADASRDRTQVAVREPPFTMHIEDMEPDESERVLEVLYRQASVPQYQCRFRWQPGSVAQWDNRCTQHYAVPDFAGQHRCMERVTIEGDRPR